MVSNPFSGEGLAVQISGDASGANTAIQSVMGNLTSMRTLAIGAGVGIAAAIGVKSVNAAREFDAAMTESLAIMGDVSDAMEDDMAAAAREVAKVTTFSANEAAESYFFLASAGLTAAESIAAMPQVAQFAQAGMFDMAQATDLLTDAASALGLEIEDYNRLADVLVKANTLANASVEQFSTALTRQAATSMRNANIEVEEGVAVLAAWADQGIKGQRAGSLFRRTIDQLQESALKNADAFAEYNVEVFDAEGNLRNMADIVEDLEDAFGDLSTEQRAAALDQLGFSIRTREGILALMGNSEAIREYQGELENAQGTTEEVANKQLDTFNSQLNLLQSRLHDVAIEIGNRMLPALEDLVRDTIRAIDTAEKWGRTLDDLTEKHLDPYIEKLNEAGFSNRQLGRAATNLSNPLNLAMILFDRARGAGERLSDTFTRLGERADRIEDNWDAAFDGLGESANAAADEAESAAERFVGSLEDMRAEAVGGISVRTFEQMVENRLPDLLEAAGQPGGLQGRDAELANALIDIKSVLNTQEDPRLTDFPKQAAAVIAAEIARQDAEEQRFLQDVFDRVAEMEINVPSVDVRNHLEVDTEVEVTLRGEGSLLREIANQAGIVVTTHERRADALGGR